MATEDAEIRRKHHRSPEDELEERSKRRKHSHRHHHHHHRRHRSKKREHESKNEEDDVEQHPSSSATAAVVVSGSNCRPDDDDKEEGEILEEDEEEERGFDLMKKKIAESDVESGEIKPDEYGEKQHCGKLGINENGYTSFDEAPDKGVLNLNDLTERNSPLFASDGTKYQLPECSDRKDVEKVHDEDDAPENSRSKHLAFSGKEYERGKNEPNFGKESGGSSENKREKQPSDSSCRDRTLALATEDFGHTSDESDLMMLKGSEASLERIEKKKKYKGVGEWSSERKGRSRTTTAKEDIDFRSPGKMDDRLIRMDHSRYAEDCSSTRASESLDFDRSSLGNQNNLLSSEREEKRYELVVARSPSREKYYDEAHIRSRSRSSDHGRHSRSRSRSHVQDIRVFHDELDVKSYSDANDRVKLLGSQDKASYNSDHERVVGYDREERRGSRDRGRERERSSSYSRPIVREDRNEIYERERQREGKRERSRSHSRHTVQEGRYDSRENERGRERNGESSSYSRYSMLEDRNGSRDRERERERDRTREREKEKEKVRQSEKEREREREREKGREREKERDRLDNGDKDRDRNSARDRHRDRGRDIEKERIGCEKDSRRSKHNGLEHHRDRTRLKDQSGLSNLVNDKFEVKEGKLERDEQEQEDYEEKVALKLAEQEEEDVDRIKEESRKRRQAILEKYKQRQLQKQDQSKTDGPVEEKGSFTVDKPVLSSSPNIVVSAASEGLLARDGCVSVPISDPLSSVEKSPMMNGLSASERTHGAGGLGDGSPKSERSMDMFSDDIFGESPAGVRKMGKGDSFQVERSGLNDNWDDAEGYYSYRFGEVLDARYEIIAAHGKGVFSTVVRAKDLKAGKGDPEEVAIKIIRNNDTMYKAGLEELVILKKLAAADPLDRRHCVRFLSSFKYRNHLCLVFESLHLNLREVLKKFGRNIGLKLAGVRAYAKQLFIALKHLRNCSVLHCDIKPDNMLVNEAKNVLKLCDFGNAMCAGKNEITPYLVSRFYRAPEIILGLPYDHPMDIWSVGCCLYELYSGKVLFPGPSNNDMLRLHMELKGPFPKKMLRKGAFTDQHFDQDLNFHAVEEDPVTKKAVKRLLVNIKPKDIGTLITGYPGEDPKMLANFKDLLEKIFVLDPEKRMTVSQALNHPFITGK